MAKMPKLSTLDRINNRIYSSGFRPHLGTSIIGNPCMRYLVYNFYWSYERKNESKLERIFRLGDAVEDIIVNGLIDIGISVTDSQLRLQDDTGHAGGSIDGLLRDIPEYPDETLLFEAKSMNHSNFLDVKSKGVKTSKPVYYAQMQGYLGRLKLSTAMFVALDKNTCELYIEFVEFDEDKFKIIEFTEKEILSANNINEFCKISNNPSWYTCKFCDAKHVCHGNDSIQKNCRTCEHSMMTYGGKWICSLTDNELDYQDQVEGCKGWILSEMWNNA